MKVLRNALGISWVPVSISLTHCITETWFSPGNQDHSHKYTSFFLKIFFKGQWTKDPKMAYYQPPLPTPYCWFPNGNTHCLRTKTSKPTGVVVSRTESKSSTMQWLGIIVSRVILISILWFQRHELWIVERQHLQWYLTQGVYYLLQNRTSSFYGIHLNS